jgi:hypothetical protein
MGDTDTFYGPKKRYGNWEVMGSYLKQGISFQDVFESFEFRDAKTGELLSGPIDRKHKDLFTKFLDEIRFPKFIRVICGGHRGRKPGLGYELDRRLFLILVFKYILPNRDIPANERTVIDNELLKHELELLLNNATPSELLKITFSQNYTKRMKRENPSFNHLTDQKTFKFDKNSCPSFRKRWNILDTDLVFSKEDETNQLGDFIPQSAFGKQRYPKEGYPLTDELNNDDLTSTSSGLQFFVLIDDINPNLRKVLEVPAGYYNKEIFQSLNTNKLDDDYFILEDEKEQITSAAKALADLKQSSSAPPPTTPAAAASPIFKKQECKKNE